MSDRRDEFEEYRGDAIYEAYRSGVNPDRLDDDRIRDAFEEGRPPESLGNDIRRRDRERREQREREQYEQEQFDAFNDQFRE